MAGVAAVLLGIDPGLTWRDVKHLLAVSARRMDPDRAQVRAAVAQALSHVPDSLGAIVESQ